MKRIILLVTAALLMAAMMALAGPASADHIRFHQHQLVTPGEGGPQVAQGLCKNRNHTAFSNFHSNVHLAAPGLDNNNAGVEIIRTECPSPA